MAYCFRIFAFLWFNVFAGNLVNGQAQASVADEEDYTWIFSGCIIGFGGLIICILIFLGIIKMVKTRTATRSQATNQYDSMCTTGSEMEINRYVSSPVTGIVPDDSLNVYEVIGEEIKSPTQLNSSQLQTAHAGVETDEFAHSKSYDCLVLDRHASEDSLNAYDIITPL